MIRGWVDFRADLDKLAANSLGGSGQDNAPAMYPRDILDTSLFPRRCPGIYLSQSYSHMCTKFG
jgi:hypothetical protein